MSRLIDADKIIQKLDDGTSKFEKERENKKGKKTLRMDVWLVLFVP